MSVSKGSPIIARLDRLAMSLLDEVEDSKSNPSAADGGTDGAPPIGFLDRLKAFEQVSKWVALKNKVDPEDTTDAFGKLADKFHGRGRKGGGSRDQAARPDGDEPGDAAPGPVSPGVNGGNGADHGAIVFDGDAED